VRAEPVGCPRAERSGAVELLQLVEHVGPRRMVGRGGTGSVEVDSERGHRILPVPVRDLRGHSSPFLTPGASFSVGPASLPERVFEWCSRSGEFLRPPVVGRPVQDWERDLEKGQASRW